MEKTLKTSWPIENESVPLNEALELEKSANPDNRQIKIDDLVKKTKNEIDSISDRVLSGEITILESTVEMGKLTHAVLEEIADKFSQSLNVEKDDLPFALFVFGATSRNQMLPNSDLDVAMGYKKDCPEEIKRKLEEVLSTLPFNDEIDFARWNSTESMRKENNPSLMEYNKIVEAKFITGNLDIARDHSRLVREQDTTEEKEKRFITQYGLLHRYGYYSRETEHGPNLKYDFGASRDIIFLDWYYLLKKTREETSDNRPTSLACLDLIQDKKLISAAEKKELEDALELVLLTRFTLWSKNEKNGDKKLLYLSDYSLRTAYEETANILPEDGIDDADKFIRAYHKAKSRLNIIVKKLSLDVASRNPDLMAIWKIAKDKKRLDDEILAILKNPTWNELVPFAIDSTSPEILQYIVERYANTPGYEYILRVISENKYITDSTKQDLLNSRLDIRFKKKLTE